MNKILKVSAHYLKYVLLMSAPFILFVPLYAQNIFYSIHVSSYKDVRNAIKETTHFKDMGYESFYRHEAIYLNNNWYRVYVSQFDSFKEAKKTGELLKKKGMINYFSIKELHSEDSNVLYTKLNNTITAKNIKKSSIHINPIFIKERFSDFNINHKMASSDFSSIQKVGFTDTLPVKRVTSSANTQYDRGESGRFFSIKDEDKMTQFIKDLALSNNTGAKSLLKGKKFIEMDIYDIYSQILTNNLNIRVSDLNKKIAGKSEKIKDAAFDPILGLSLSYSRADTKSRSESINRRRFIGTDYEDVEGNSYKDKADGALGATTVDDQTIINENMFKTSQENEYASIENHPPYLPDTWASEISLAKQFSWGQSLGLKMQSTLRDKNLSIGEWSYIYYLDPNNPPGKYPWASNFYCEFLTPLPFCKNFGTYGSPLYVQKKLSEINETKESWKDNLSKNEILKNVLFMYWDLVKTIKNLQIIMIHEKNLEQMVKDAAISLKEKQKTVYELSQIKTRLENMFYKEELAWTNLIAISNQIVEQLGYDHNSIFLPKNYTLLLNCDNPGITDNGKWINKALNSSPNLKITQSEKEGSDALYKFRKNQNKPDVSLVLNLNFNQSDSYYGYGSFMDSVSNVFNPDNSLFYVGITTSWPFFNCLQKVSLYRAGAENRQSSLKVIQKENETIQAINTLISNIRSNENKISQADKNQELKEQSFKEAKELYDDNEITEFELLSKQEDFLLAKFDYLDSTIENKKAYIELLSTTGVLDDKANL